jgi:uncharacterized repeat protein (TIGR02543 family)
MKMSFVFFLLALLLGCIPPLRAQTPPTGFTNSLVSSGWNQAVGMTFNSTGSKMFVWERAGRVWVVVNGQRQQILDIAPEVGSWHDHGLMGFALDPNFDTNGYLYLLYLVDRHHLLYFGTSDYSDTDNDYATASIGRLTRYTATPAGTGYTVDQASRRVLLGATKTTGIPSLTYSHLTGSLVFGADGTLLVSTGDGAHAAPDEGSHVESYYDQALDDGIISVKENVGSLRAQLVDCLNGKILRLDPATGAGVPSNPFYDAANPNAPRSKVWALGLRNPFRMSRKPGTGSTNPSAGNPGTLYIGDVGSCCWEEIHVVDRAGVNLGWPIFEGLIPNDDFYTSTVYNRDAPNPLYGTGGCTKEFFYFPDLIKQATPSGTATFPNSCNPSQPIPASIPTFVHSRALIDWGHPDGPSRTGTFSGQTATTANLGAAGSPVSGSRFGGIAAVGGVFYPYTDFPVQYRNTYFFGDYGGWIRSLTVNSANQPSAVSNFVDDGVVPVCFATSPGETGLFYVNFDPSQIRKITYLNTSGPPVAVASSDKTFGSSPLAVQFTGSASTTPSGSLTYRWDFGDGTPTSPAANPSHPFTAPTADPIKYTVTLTVTNTAGLTNQTSLTISVNNTPPRVTITSPANNSTYPLTGNTTYQLRATVVDAEHSGHLLSYAWQTALHHNTHVHPDPIDTTRQTSTIIVPLGCGAESYYYTVSLTVTDAEGLASTQEVRLNPDCNTLTFTLVNADAAADVDIQPLGSGAVLNLATLPTRNLNIRANANPATTGSIVFSLSGAETRSQTDSEIPYALFSDVSGDYNAWTPTVGSYTLTATPFSGGGGGGTAGTPLTVSFSVIDSATYSLTTNVVGSGSIVRSPNAGSYASGTVVSLTATPAPGLQFTGWSGDASGSTNPLSVTMNANKTITATFGGAFAFYRAVNLNGPALTLDGNAWAGSTAPNYSTSGLPFANQSVVLNPATDAARASLIRAAVYGPSSLSVTLTAVPAGSYQAYVYVWEDNNPETFTLALNGQTVRANYNSGPAGTWDRLGPYPVTLPAPGQVQLTASGGTANFSGVELWQQTGGPAPQYSLAVNTSGSGTVSKSPDQATYTSGTTVSLTATPGAGQQFSGWSGDASGNVNPLSVSMSSNKSITATFTAVAAQYSLTVNTTGSGSVSKTPNQATYASGSTVSLSATAAAGFQFTGWSGDASGSTNPLSVIMTANKTITATFTAVVGTQVTSFTLVNADNEQDIQPLSNGASLNLAALPTRNLNVRATTSPATVGSVVWALRGSQVVDQTDAAAPYALFLDNAGNYPPWTPAVGSYTLQATPYASGGGSGLTFYRALNINGGAVSLDGQSWEASTGAANFTVSGTAFANQAVVLNPATDATRASLIRSSVYGTTINAALSTVPAGTYSVYLYVWEDNNAETYTLRLENQVALANYNSGPAGHWDRLGPYSVNVSDGTLDINLSGGYANLSGIEVWRQTSSGTPGTSLSIGFSVVDQGPGPFTLTVNTSGSGTVSKSPDQPTYASGSIVSVTATPGAGQQFSGWSGDATGTANPLSVTMTSNKAITATFTATGGGGLTFYRALNINGGAVNLDGQSWEASDGAANFSVSGTAFANQAVVLNPATDATRATLIRSSVYDTDLDATLGSVPAGTYLVYLYVWEDNNAETYDIRLENQVVLANYNSGPAGHWDRLGPYPVSLSDGTLDLSLSGGYVNLSGIEVWRQNAARAALVPAASGTAASAKQLALLPAQAYPNPSADGQFQLLLPQELPGAVSYTLVSPLGTRLASGQLDRPAGAALLKLDFSREMANTGLYYLLLSGPQQSTHLRLMRY